MKTILICTVGGSHQPIIKAIQKKRPGFVCFVCSDDDPTTGRPGSYTQIRAKGNKVISKGHGEEPSLPNIPTQLDMADDMYEVLRVNADDFDAAYMRIYHYIQKWNPEEWHILADYTGGTKTMTAALVAAALDTGNTELHFVSGARKDLTKVADGTEHSMSVSVGNTRFYREARRALDAWKRFSYAESSAMLSQIQPPQHVRDIYIAADGISNAFAAWDCFDHKKALDLLDTFSKRLGSRGKGGLIGTLKLLATGDGIRSDILKVYDIWLNAGRRSKQQHYDDATARWYRMLEWTAQCLLNEREGIKTGDIPKDRLPASVKLSENSEGKLQAGLFQAWEILAKIADKDGDIADFWKKERTHILDLVQMRNSSLLAHGFRPVGQEDWERIAGWTENSFFPWFNALADGYGIRQSPEQLCYKPEDIFPELWSAN